MTTAQGAQAKRVRKVVAYLVRDGDLLVFEHRDHPEAGVQVPAGTVAENEELSDAVLRETEEETGLDSLGIVRYLGSEEFQDAEQETERHYYLLAVDDAPDKWIHWERHAGGGEEFAFAFYWMAIDEAAKVLHPKFAVKLEDVTGPAADSESEAAISPSSARETL